jgi:hypothetical protein
MRKKSKSTVRRPAKGYEKRVVITISPGKSGDGGRWCKVDAGTVYVRYGGSVTFRGTKGCGPCTVFVPKPSRAPRVFPALRTVHSHVSERKSKTFRVLPKKHATTHVREYPYAVYCHKHNCFAKGSMPRMIIGPEHA